jgi:hypothetical protein
MTPTVSASRERRFRRTWAAAGQPDLKPDRAALKARRPRLPRQDSSALRDHSSRLACPVSGSHLDRRRVALTARAPFIPFVPEKHCRTCFLANRPFWRLTSQAPSGSHRGLRTT